MQNYRLPKFRSIIDAVDWVCDDALEENVWVSELKISCQDSQIHALSSGEGYGSWHQQVSITDF